MKPHRLLIIALPLLALGGCAGGAHHGASSTDAPPTRRLTMAPHTALARLAQPAPPKASPFVVHEWGTFTSVQGSNGEALVGMHTSEEPLPKFVHTRAKRARGKKSYEAVPAGVTQRMETPVIYFYGGARNRARVEVGFPAGVITEWYPDAASFKPALRRGRDRRVPKNGFMAWDVDLAAPDRVSQVRSQIPKVPKKSIWAPSRAVDARLLTTGARRKEAEHFLFYRGMARFKGSLTVRSTSRAAGPWPLVVTNEGPATIRSVVLLRVSPDGKQGAVYGIGRLAKGARRPVAIPARLQPMARYLVRARAILARALIRSGLYAKEAWGMVNTWSHSYFKKPGLRVLYLMAPSVVDKLLPLRVEPKPQQIVRTFVGRVEVLTPGEEAEVGALVNKAHGQGRPIDVKALGRFAEPKLRRALQRIADAGVKALIRRTIDKLP